MEPPAQRGPPALATATTPVRTMVVNDYAVVAAGVAAMLRPYADRVQVVETDWSHGLPDDVDVVLYDTYGSLASDEAEVYERVARSGAKLAVFSWAYDEELVRRSMAAGACGYLSKRLAPRQLAAAIELVHAGELVSPGRARLAESQEHGDWPGLDNDLSSRESEIVALIARGLSNQEIADRTFLSINSVKTYVRTAYRKMGVSSRSQAVRWALVHGFSPGASPVSS